MSTVGAPALNSQPSINFVGVRGGKPPLSFQDQLVKLSGKSLVKKLHDGLVNSESIDFSDKAVNKKIQNLSDDHNFQSELKILLTEKDPIQFQTKLNELLKDRKLSSITICYGDTANKQVLTLYRQRPVVYSALLPKNFVNKEPIFFFLARNLSYTAAGTSEALDTDGFQEILKNDTTNSNQFTFNDKFNDFVENVYSADFFNALGVGHGSTQGQPVESSSKKAAFDESMIRDEVTKTVAEIFKNNTSGPVTNVGEIEKEVESYLKEKFLLDDNFVGHIMSDITPVIDDEQKVSDMIIERLFPSQK
jgi:hypothetical protein